MTREEEIKQVSEEVLGTVEYQCGFADGARWADETIFGRLKEYIKYFYIATESDVEDFKNEMEGGEKL